MNFLRTLSSVPRTYDGVLRTLDTDPRTLEDDRRTPERNQWTPEDERRTQEGILRTLDNDLRTLEGDRRTPEGVLRTLDTDPRTLEGDRRTPERNQWTPEDERRTQEGVLRTLDNDLRILEGDRRTPEGERRTPEGDRQTSETNFHSPAAASHILKSSFDYLYSMQIKEFQTPEEMVEHLSVLRELYPNLSAEYYLELLTEMVPHNYHQIGVFKDGECIAVSGYWIGRKLWCGLYLELDNVVVRKSAQGTGAGKLMEDYLRIRAEEMKCHIMVLDAYTSNFKAHRFYYNQGYAPKGFHFIKVLDKDGLT